MSQPRTQNQAFRGAYWKGRVARRKGLGVTKNPYSNREGWGRIFHRYWLAGWRDQDKQTKKKSGG